MTANACQTPASTRLAATATITMWESCAMISLVQRILSVCLIHVLMGIAHFVESSSHYVLGMLVPLISIVLVRTV